MAAGQSHSLLPRRPGPRALTSPLRLPVCGSRWCPGGLSSLSGLAAHPSSSQQTLFVSCAEFPDGAVFLEEPAWSAGWSFEPRSFPTARGLSGSCFDAWASRMRWSFAYNSEEKHGMEGYGWGQGSQGSQCPSSQVSWTGLGLAFFLHFPLFLIKASH